MRLLLYFVLGCTCALAQAWAQPPNPVQQPGTPKPQEPGAPRPADQAKPRPVNDAKAALAPSALIASQPLTLRDRINWTISSTVGVPNLVGGLFISGISTANNNPSEWNTHWDGYWQRYGLRMTGSATSNVMEAGFGALWGEDPRYRPSGKREFRGRLWSIVEGTWMAHDRDGNEVPAYARYIAIPGSNAIANSWRPDSQRTFERTLERTGYGFLGRMTSNAFAEFLPEIKKLIGLGDK